MLMHPFRRALLIFISPFFPLLLFLTALNFGIVQTVGNPKDIKTIISESGLYSGVVPSLMDQMKQVDTSVGQIPTSDPTIRQAANQSFTPAEVQRNAEGAIDSIYAWLDGKTPQPNFKIDLSNVQSSFAANLATAVQQKAASLPPCTTPYTSTSFDVYSATCLPRGVTPASVAAQVKSDAAGGKGLIDKPVITSADLKSGNSGQSVFSSQLKGLPTQYQRVKKTPILLIALTILCAAAIIFLSTSRARGLRRVGITLVVVGLFMLAFSWGLNRANTNFIQPKISLSNPVMQADMRKLVTDIVQRIDKNYWTFGGVYAALGLAALAGPVILQKRGRLPHKETDSPAGQVGAAPEEEAMPAPSPKPKS
ncbi:MAG: hypothetical protein JWO96_569 [Candidatus Saccharibacteria bacterium]|nr:hypothetical protein [Candidatus Saccharibacteria bacterium]